MIAFGAAYYPEHRDFSKWEYDLDLMAKAGVNALRVGEFAWTRFEPADGKYDFGWMDDFAGKAHARGISLLMCPPLRTAPAWLVTKDRSILMTDSEGRPLEFGSRYTFCINHPLLRDKGLGLARQMARRYGGNPSILGWHLDNEYGDEPDCHCRICVAKWQKWLQKRYGTIEALNFAWGNVFWSLEYNRFDQVPTPRHTKAFHSPAHLLAWRRFRSDCTVEMVGLHAAALRDNGVTRPVTTNNQSLWNPRTDYYDLAKHLDVCGTNYYPPYGPACRAGELGLATVRSYKQAPFQVHELRCGPHGVPGLENNTPAPGEVARLTMHAVANGADGIFYFRWRTCPFGCEQTHGSITDYDGRPTRTYREVAVIGNRLKAIAPVLEGTTVSSDAAILYDFPTRWIMETGISWNGPKDLYIQRCKLMYEALRAQGINVDAIGRNQDFSRYRLLVVPFVSAMDDTLADKLAQFVHGGGTLLWHPLSGAKTVEASFYPARLHPTLGRLFGITIEDYATAPLDSTHTFTWNGQSFNTGGFFDLLHLNDAAVHARFTSDWFADRPALTELRTGKGRALYLASLPPRPFYESFFPALLKECGIQPLLNTLPPAAVEVAIRTAPNGRRLLFLLNTSAEPQTVSIPDPRRDIWNDETVQGSVILPPQGVRILTAP